MLGSKKTIFKLKIPKEILFFSLFFYACCSIFTIYWAVQILNYSQGRAIKLSEKTDGAYSIDFRVDNLQSSESSASLYMVISTICLVSFLSFSLLIAIMANKNPFVFNKRIQNSKRNLTLTLVSIEISTILYATMLFFMFSELLRGIHKDTIIFENHSANALQSGLITQAFDITSYNHTLSDFLIYINCFLFLLYLGCSLSYFKSGVFPWQLKFLVFIPFASLFFVNRYIKKGLESGTNKEKDSKNINGFIKISYINNEITNS
ncbi:hypothetical protein LNO75_03385 [Mycoplasma sp. T363T]|uniref:Uncharacterized protein n=1 Tax=Mycoplasma bradburyae TaxID=2963128 RepID=A0AAW6HPJ9_9MOLU|nr:hypothetical protein [Mycoplasma bradburyae]MDC4163602.1 hypothetical protein [Mycoplasma bradburyae]MDC4183705.1 hypothetical protein [Mycoplasma bradburyae]UTS70757.1 hypothetical protein NMG77_03325 [Mycoplasma bradburyae]